MGEKASSSTSFNFLPEELMEKVLISASENDFKDMIRAKMTCKTLNQIGGDEKFLKSVSLFINGILVAMTPKLVEFMESCWRAGNADLLFLRGISMFLYESNGEVIDGGVRYIKQATKGECEFAKYAYEILHKEMWPQCTDDSIPERGRVHALQIRHKVLGLWNLWEENNVGMHVVKFLNEIGLGWLEGCRCAEYDHWRLWWHDGVKGVRMCDSCFWKLETWFFSYHFPQKFGRWPFGF